MTVVSFSLTEMDIISIEKPRGENKTHIGFIWPPKIETSLPGQKEGSWDFR